MKKVDGFMNTAFRLTIFILFALSMLAAFFVFARMIPEVDNLDGITKRLVGDVVTVLRFFYFSLGCGVIALALSVLSARGAKPVFVVLRTLCIGVVVALQFGSLKLVNVMHDIFATLNAVDFSEASDFEGVSPEDVGLAQNQLDAFHKMTEDGSIEIICFAMSVICALAVYFVLSATSAANLISARKKQIIERDY